MRKIVLAFDSFKGCMTSLQVADAAKRAILDNCPQCDVRVVNIADGGEGTVDAICSNLAGRVQTVTCRTYDPLMRPMKASYSIADKKTAIIETASAAGLTLIPDSERNPERTTSYGVGRMIADAIDRGCREFIVGLGGSATNDAATGILAALGYEFLDDAGTALEPIGANLGKITRIETERADRRLKECRFTLACDVENPFCGTAGAAYVYAPQKGADEAMTERLDSGLASFAKVLSRTFGCDVADRKGAGAAGGIGGTLIAALGATMCRGIDIVLDLADFDRIITDADLVMTGEGAIDEQSAMGKTISGILRRTQPRGVRVVALAGKVSNVEQLNALGLSAVFSIQQQPMPLAEAMNPMTASKGVYSVTSQILKLLK